MSSTFTSWCLNFQYLRESEWRTGSYFRPGSFSGYANRNCRFANGKLARGKIYLTSKLAGSTLGQDSCNLGNFNERSEENGAKGQRRKNALVIVQKEPFLRIETFFSCWYGKITLKMDCLKTECSILRTRFGSQQRPPFRRGRRTMTKVLISGDPEIVSGSNVNEFLPCAENFEHDF